MPQVGLAITGALTAFKAMAVGAFLTTTIGGRLLGSVALSALQMATVRKPRAAGLTNERKGTGSTNPRGFPLGLCATDGDEACTPMTHGKVGKVPNAYATFVIILSDVPGCGLSRMAVDKEWVTISGAAHPDYGQEVLGRFNGFMWVKFYNGTQTVADPMLLAKYATYPNRPWTADMVLTGCAYAIITCRANPKIFTSEPQFRFELTSIPLYDPRKDTTVGGSGAHRWANKATWEPSNNPKVMEYNILRGTEVPACGIWGGAATANDLPLANWFTAMNECDVVISTLAGNVPQYRAGHYVTVNEAPADVIDDLNVVCTGQTAEIGGTFKTRVGGPGLPVLFITDDDWVVTQPQDYDPFDRADQRPNYITANYPEPANVWGPRPAPALANAGWEIEDGGRRETALEFAACPYIAQVQRVMASYAKDGRRARKHGGYLPPDAAVLEPLDTLSWTSARNGYTAKVFEISSIDDGARNMLQHPSLREADPADYGWSPGAEVPVTNPSSALPTTPTQVVDGFAVNPLTLLDASGAVRGFGVEILWNGAEHEGVRAIEYEAWLGGVKIKTGNTTDVASGRTEATSGLIRGTAYQVRIRPVADWPTDWTAFLTVTTPAVLITSADLLITGHHGGALNSDPFTRDITAWTFEVAPSVLVTTPDSPVGGTSNLRASTTSYAFSEPFSIDPAKNYFAEGWIRQNVGSTTAFLLIAFYDAAGNVVNTGGTGWFGGGSYRYFGIAGTVPVAGLPANFFFSRYTGAFGPDEVAKIPTGAKTARIGYLANVSGGAGVQDYAGLRCVEQTRRTALDPKSLQDVFRTVNPAYYDNVATTNNFLLATLNIGAVASGAIWRRSVHFECRRPATYATHGGGQPRVELQRRSKKLGGGVWSAWSTQSFWQESALYETGIGIGDWDIIDDSGTIGSPRDEIEYRLILVTDTPVGPAGVNWIGNVWLTVAAITKGGA